MKLFGREPALWLGLIETTLAVVVALAWHLTGEQVGLINAAAAAVVGLLAAVAVRPFPVPLLLGAVRAVLGLAVGFGLALTGEQVGLLNAAAAALVAVIMRVHVEPTAAPAPAAPLGRPYPMS